MECWGAEGEPDDPLLHYSNPKVGPRTTRKDAKAPMCKGPRVFLVFGGRKTWNVELGGLGGNLPALSVFQSPIGNRKSAMNRSFRAVTLRGLPVISRGLCF